MHPIVFRTSLLLLCLIAGIPPAEAYAERECGTCQGHYVLFDSDFPFSEDITHAETITVGNTWKTIQKGCITARNSDGQDIAINGVNLDTNSSVRVNAFLRAFVEITSATPGTRFEVRFVRKMVGSEDILATYGWYLRTVKSGFPQGEIFHSTIQNLETGSHRIELQARAIDSGYSFTSKLQWLTVQGMPSDGNAPGVATRFPSDKQVKSNSYVIDGTWRSDVFDTIQFHNTVPVDIFPQAYFEINGGTAGDRLSVGFQLDEETSSRRTSDIIVPGAAGWPLRAGINIVDHIENVPPGTHTLRFWAVNRNNRQTTVSSRNLEFGSLPTDTGTWPGAHLIQVQLTDTRTVNSSTSPGVFPKTLGTGTCGYWVPISDEISMPTSSGSYNWFGGGYVRITGRSGDWTKPRAEFAIEVYQNQNGTIVTTDMAHIPITVPAAGGELYFFSDAFRWGTDFTNKVRLWMRKVEGPEGCGGGGTDGDFTIANRYLAMKLVPMDNGGCYYRGCDPNKPPSEGGCN